MATKALIKPKILRWARQRSSLTVGELANKALVTPEQVSLWETSETDKPTLTQAQKLADVMRIPLGYFYLSSPPQVSLQIPDLRTMSKDKRDSFSLDFLDLLDETFIKHDWYRQYLKEQGAEPLSFIGKFKGKVADEFAIANDIAGAVGLTSKFRNAVSSPEVFLSKFIERVEGLGVLVLRSGVVGNNNTRILNVEEFRGFVITDNIAPIIFINSKDSRAAMIFTLAHELAHLWIGESGITNPDMGKKYTDNTPDIERMCNRIAAEVLVPKKSFLELWEVQDDIHANIGKLKKLFRVSSLVILKRAFDIGVLQWSEFIKEFNEEKELYRKREEKASSDSDDGNFYNTIGARHNRKLISAILTATFEGRESFGEAARMLGVKVPTLEKIANNFGIK